MALRHDDELPPLTSDQQAEAIRLAVRLQAAHEEARSSHALLQAAAEAGIEERFLREAVERVARGPKWNLHPPEERSSHRADLALLLITLAGLLGVTCVAPEFAALIAESVLMSFLVALVPASQRRPRVQVYLAALGAGALVDIVLALSKYDVHGEFTNFGWSQLATIVLGAAFARLAYGGFRRSGRPRGSAHRPQSV